MKKRALLVALAAAMAASLAGCGGSSASSTTAAAGSAAEGSEAAGETAADASGKDSLVIVTSSDVLSMDPYRYDEDLQTRSCFISMRQWLPRMQICPLVLVWQKAGRPLRMV